MENQTLVKCSHCENEFKADEMTEIHDGSLVCEKCLENEFSLCDETNLYYPADEMTLVYYADRQGRKIDSWVHDSCLSGNYLETENGEWVREKDTFEVKTGRNTSKIISRWDYDNGDYFTCDDCGEIFDCERSNYLSDLDRHVCDYCNEHYGSCEHCGDTYHCDNGPSCGCEDEESLSDLIHSYSFTPVLKFRGDSTNKNPFIGFELEIESKDGSKREQAELCNDVCGDVTYLKDDGSLSDGFEIVSHPMTIEEHKKENYESLFKGLSKLGAVSHNTTTCGLHFHVDKRNMSDAHKVRFGSFFALSKNKLEVLARRTSKNYAKFKEKGLDLKNYASSDSRYEAINWTNDNTLEVRIFKGTLKYETFMASMELCHAVFLFSRKASNFEGPFEENILWAGFIKFLKSNSEKYPFLLSYIDSKQEKLNESIKLDDLETQKRKLDKVISETKINLEETITNA